VVNSSAQLQREIGLKKFTVITPCSFISSPEIPAEGQNFKKKSQNNQKTENRCLSMCHQLLLSHETYSVEQVDVEGESCWMCGCKYWQWSGVLESIKIMELSDKKKSTSEEAEK
jgi:hypothetical protein